MSVRRRHWLAAGLALAALGLGLGLWFGLRRGDAVPRHPHVLLVTIDTLRADRLGCYGHAAARTPVLDALASRGVRFATAVAHTPLTAPSHASILSGLTPPRHGVRDNGGFTFPEDLPTLSEAFRAAGFETAAFVSGFPLDRRFGFTRGFDLYDDRLARGDDPRRAAYVERTADATTSSVLRWLESRPEPGRPFFLWVHYFDPHAPYEAPIPHTDPYDGEVAFADAALGTLLRRLDERDELARTITLVTADHGESLGEHGEDTHGVFIYDATLRVPWIMAGPGLPRGRVVSTVARGIDVAPTLLDLAGIDSRPVMEGRSLRPAAGGKEMADAPAYVESLFARLHLGWASLQGWRTSRWKLIDAPRLELYALDRDAAERHNRAREEPQVVAELRRRLAATIRAPQAPLVVKGEARERLAALGYLGGTASEAADDRGQRDPKDGIALVNRLERAIAEARTAPQHAAEELARVLADDPDIALARRYRAIALASSGAHTAAIAEIRKLEALAALHADDLVLLAECFRLAGRADEALHALDRAHDLDPRAPEIHLVRARLLAARGRRGEAAEAYQTALRLVSNHPAARRGLGDLALAQGNAAGAIAHYRQALDADPGDLHTSLQLGVAQVRAGHLAAALPLLDEVSRKQPANAEAQVAMAGALAKAGRPAEAIPYFERALAAQGPSRVVLNGLGFARLESGDVPGALVALRASLSLEPGQPEVADVVRRVSGAERK